MPFLIARLTETSWIPSSPSPIPTNPNPPSSFPSVFSTTTPVLNVANGASYFYSSRVTNKRGFTTVLSLREVDYLVQDTHHTRITDFGLGMVIIPISSLR